MGGIESKFNALLEQGKQTEAVEMWDANVELLHQYNPNSAIRWNDHGDTPLHCAARHEMQSVVVRLMERGGSPFVKNSDEQTALHLVCTSARHSSRTSKRRAALLEVLLAKVDPVKEKGSYLDVKDRSKNTPLHLAAASGLLDCVEVLLAHGAPLFVRNIAGQTPCDTAGSAKQLIVAKLLESQMVLVNAEDITNSTAHPRSTSFYTPEALQALKKELVERLAARLQILPSPAEALLQTFGWSEELVIEVWNTADDITDVCKRAGLDLIQFFPDAGRDEMSLTAKTCEICLEDIPLDNQVFTPCRHHICKACWPRFLEVQIHEAGGREIRCPAHGCFRVIPNEVIASVVSTELFQKYTTLNLQQFVSEYSGLEWCPHPGCGQAVATPKNKDSEGKKGLNLWCGNGHAFCWNCKQEAHEPCGCDLWEKWKTVVMEMSGTYNKSVEEAIANTRWLVSYTKPCPHCSAPIQKNEGCNHMTCKKCRYEFCWVCFGSWSDHGNKTGGYFSCNRYKQQEKAQQDLEKIKKGLEEKLLQDVIQDAEEKKKYFDHYHSRYLGHCHSVQIELKLFEGSGEKSNQLIMLRQVLESNVEKLKEVMVSSTNMGNGSPANQSPAVATATETPSALVKGNLFEDSLFVLISCRQVLSASYALGYFIPSNTDDKRSHESIQGQLEEPIERLAQMLNRPYLRTPHHELVKEARCVEEECKKYLEAARPIAQRASEAAENHT